MLGRNKFALRKCFCTAKAFYGAKAPKGTEWVRVPASILGVRGALALSGNSRWLFFSGGIAFGRRGLAFAGQDAGENGGGAENGADAAGGFAKRKEIKFR